MEFLAAFGNVSSLVAQAQPDDGGGGGAAGGLLGMGASCVFLILYFGVLIACIVSFWKIFVKAGEPGWAAIIPIYNAVIMLKIINKPIWWIIFLIIPCTAPIFGIIIAYFLAEAFGKSIAFFIGMLLLPFVFYPILGFGSSQYQGTKSA